jgi:L-malate glycosyltransferase
VGGNPELVEHERRGLTVSPNDAAGLAEVLTRLIENPDERARYAGAAAEFVSSQLALPVMAARMMEIYDEAVGFSAGR